MAELDDALKLVTDPANVSPLHVSGAERQFAVNGKRVVRKLRDLGAGKAEARELALEALAKVGGGAELRSSRGTRAAGRGADPMLESWWVPADAVRFEQQGE